MRRYKRPETTISDIAYGEIFDKFLFNCDSEGLAKYAEERGIDLFELRDSTGSGIDRSTIQGAIDINDGNTL